MQSIIVQPVFFFLATLLLSKFPNTAVAESSSNVPHSLYMHRLLEHISHTTTALHPEMGRSDPLEDFLVASIETQMSEGRGFSNQGFSFGVTNKLKLVFTIPKLSDEIRYVPAVELWIFPNLSGVSRNKIVEMTFIALASIPQASDDRTDTFSQTWNTNEDCVSLDLTGLNKKIYRVLHKKNLNESTVTLTIEIIARKTITSTMESNLLNHDLCSALSERSTNDSFLVIKNYNGEIAPASVGVDAGEESETESDIIIAGDEEGDEMLNSTANPSDLDACRVVPLVVNITDLYDFIEAPVQTNIGDCSGKCSLSLHRELFSQHAEIKERLKLLPGGEALSEYSPKCMPVHLSPLHALISLHSRSKVIVQFPDTVVDQCICQ